MTDNQYITYYKSRPTEELKEITFQENLYEDEARLAALLILKDRGEISNENEESELKALEEKIKAKKESVLKEQEKAAEIKMKNNSDENALPELYSPVAILGFSLFFSLIFGAVLMFLNLKKLGKSTQAINVLLVSVSIMVLMYFASIKFQLSQVVMLLINLGGGLLLIEFFWKKHVGIHTKFKKKPIAKAVLVSVIISIIVLATAYFIFKDQLPTP